MCHINICQQQPREKMRRFLRRSLRPYQLCIDGCLHVPQYPLLVGVMCTDNNTPTKVVAHLLRLVVWCPLPLRATAIQDDELYPRLPNSQLYLILFRMFDRFHRIAMTWSTQLGRMLVLPPVLPSTILSHTRMDRIQWLERGQSP
jgi:hypothetical protein